MQKSFAKSARLALGLALLFGVGGIGCGGSSGGQKKDSGADATEDGAAGAVGTDGGTAGAAAGTDGGAAGAAAGTDGGAAGAAAGTDGGTAGAAAGTDGGTAGATAGTDGGTAGADSGTVDATDGGADATDASNVSDASDAGDAADASDAACTDACTLTATRCGTGGGVQTCIAGPSTCTVWSVEAACGAHSQCTQNSVAAAMCSCKTDPNCASGTATFCANGTTLSTCGTDNDGCFFVQTTASCPAHESCSGSNPSAVCSCDTPPSDCAGAAGTFCATSASVSTCTQDPTTHCIYVSGTANCGGNQSCSGSPGVGACACNAPPAGCTAPGTFCANGSSSVCTRDAQGCFSITSTTACSSHETCNGSTGLCECNAGGCSVAGTFCDGSGKLETCSTDGTCFFVTGTPQACGSNQTCTGAAGSGTCSCNAAPSACVGGKAGTFCSAGNTVTTCAPDAQGCIVVSATPAACGARQTCTGTAGSQTCTCNAPPAGCTGSGTFCPDTNDQSTCAADGDGCFFVSGSSACPSNQTCKGPGIGNACTCDNTCAAAQAGGTYCTDGAHQASCANDGNGCHLSSNTTACAGIKTCRGVTGGAGSCLCPATGVTLGTGCSVQGATICAGNTVLTCTTDGPSGCLSWTTPNDCAASGLVCGTKSSVAACQCPAHSGNDYIVDPVAGSDAQTGVFPTGIDSPEACRFGTLGKGLAAAISGNRVVAKTDSGSANFSGETFPLSVGNGVTLTTNGVLQPANNVIEYNGAGAAVVVGTGSVVEGFTIVDNSGSGSAISITGTNATVDTVDVTGGFPTGISVSGGGQGLINAVTISGPTTGLSISTTAAGAVTLSNSTINAAGTGVALANGTLATSAVTVSGGTGVGVAITAAGGALATLNGTTLNVNSMAGAGISQSASGGTAVLNYISGDLGHNGATGSVGGIVLSAGSATLGAVSVHDNTGPGVTVSTAGTGLTLGATTVTGNSAAGISAATSATVNFNTGATITSNGGNGVLANTATLNFNGAAATPIVVTSNTGDGIGVTNGSLTANYLTLSSNGTGTTKHDGLKVAGVAAVSVGINSDAVVLVKSNGANGVDIAGTTAGSAIDFRRATIQSNGADGILADLNGGTGAPGATGSFSGVTVTGNASNGIEVTRAPLISSVIKLTFDSMTITSNGAAGVTLTGAAAVGTGDVGASLTNSKVTGNTGVGVNVAEVAATTTETIQNDTITGNGGGGVTFGTPSTLNGFTGNVVAGNTGDQITVSARPNGATTTTAAWLFQSPGQTCDANRNQVYCYSGSGVGIRVNASLGTTVNAADINWVHSAPTAGTDFVATTLNAVQTSIAGQPNSGPCTAITSCP